MTVTPASAMTKMIISTGSGSLSDGGIVVAGGIKSGVGAALKAGMFSFDGSLMHTHMPLLA